MADGGGMDPCECVWSHEMAMQRLMNLLRNSQTACTDTDCAQDDLLRGDMGATGGFSSIMMIMLGWMVVATALYFLRPSTMRRSQNEKPSGGGNGRFGDEGGNPPAPSVH